MSGKEVAQFSPYFPAIWDRILEYMRYEDKIDNHLMGDLQLAHETEHEPIKVFQVGRIWASGRGFTGHFKGGLTAYTPFLNRFLCTNRN